MIGSSTARHDQHHDRAHRDDQQRLEDRRHLQRAALHFGAELARGALEHQRQLAGLLAQAREHREQPGEALLAGERRGQRRAFAHQHQRVHRIGAHRPVRQRFGRGLQRLQDRHAGAGQHRQRAGEARRVVAARQPADQRQRQPGRVEALAEGLVAQHQRQHAEAGADQQRQQPAEAAQERADPEHRDRQRRQRALRAREHRGDLRHDVGDEEDHDDDRDQRDDRRVERRADQPALELLALLQVVGQALEHPPRAPLCSPAATTPR